MKLLEESIEKDSIHAECFYLESVEMASCKIADENSKKNISEMALNGLKVTNGVCNSPEKCNGIVDDDDFDLELEASSEDGLSPKKRIDEDNLSAPQIVQEIEDLLGIDARNVGIDEEFEKDLDILEEEIIDQNSHDMLSQKQEEEVVYGDVEVGQDSVETAKQCDTEQSTNDSPEKTTTLDDVTAQSAEETPVTDSDCCIPAKLNGPEAESSEVENEDNLLSSQTSDFTDCSIEWKVIDSIESEEENINQENSSPIKQGQSSLVNHTTKDEASDTNKYEKLDCETDVSPVSPSTGEAKKRTAPIDEEDEEKGKKPKLEDTFTKNCQKAVKRLSSDECLELDLKRSKIQDETNENVIIDSVIHSEISEESFPVAEEEVIENEPSENVVNTQSEIAVSDENGANTDLNDENNDSEKVKSLSDDNNEIPANTDDIGSPTLNPEVLEDDNVGTEPEPNESQTTDNNKTVADEIELESNTDVPVKNTSSVAAATTIETSIKDTVNYDNNKELSDENKENISDLSPVKDTPSVEQKSSLTNAVNKDLNLSKEITIAADKDKNKQNNETELEATVSSVTTDDDLIICDTTKTSTTNLIDDKSKTIGGVKANRNSPKPMMLKRSIDKLQKDADQPSKSQLLSDMDEFIETVAVKTKQSLELPKFREGQLRQLTRSQLEDLVLVKYSEAIANVSDVGHLRKKCQKLEETIEVWKTKAHALQKQVGDLDMILTKYLAEVAEAKKAIQLNKTVMPIKVTRSVGLQVVLSSALEGSLASSLALRKKSVPFTPQKEVPKIPGPIQIPVLKPLEKQSVPESKRIKTNSPSVSSVQTVAVPIITPKPRGRPPKHLYQQTTVSNRTPSLSSDKIMTPSKPSRNIVSKTTVAPMELEIIDLTEKDEKITQTEPSPTVPTNRVAPFPTTQVCFVQQRPGAGLSIQPSVPRKNIQIPVMLTQKVNVKSPARLGNVTTIAPTPPTRVQVQAPLKHPAPLPVPPVHQTTIAGLKAMPPKPQLKIAKTSNGLMLSWSMTLNKDYAEITVYQLYAYQEEGQIPCEELWKKVGNISALPLPMACTLTQFVEGHKYHFAIRAVDAHGRCGPFSLPSTILLSK